MATGQHQSHIRTDQSHYDSSQADAAATSAPPASGRPARRWWPWVAGGALLLSTLIVYLPAMRAGYIWDDDEYVRKNPTLRSAEGLRRIWFEPGATPQYYPLVHTSYWLEYRLWRLDPTGYHVVNIILHGVGAVLVWRVLLTLGLPAAAAWFAAALFALHPVHVESVAWITERKNVLSGVFYLSAALACLRFLGISRELMVTRGSRWSYYAAALLLFQCALFSKTVTCSLPAALLLILWWKRGRIRWSDVAALLPFFLLGLALSVVTIQMEQGHVVGESEDAWDLSLIDRVLIAGRALWFYAEKLLWPARLTFTYPRWQIDAGLWWQYLFPAAAVAVVAGLWLARRRIGRGPLVALLFFGGTLLPALGFIDLYPMRYSFVADHFQYLASLGLITLVVASGHQISGRIGAPLKVPGLMIAVLALGTLGSLTWRQQHMYKDIETLWRVTIDKNLVAWMAYNNLGAQLAGRKKYDEAIHNLHLALKLKPDYVEAHNNLGWTLAAQGRFDEAIASYRRALQIKPGNKMNFRIHHNLGLALQSTGQIDNAISHYRRAVQIKPRHVPGHKDLGAALVGAGKPDEAIAVLYPLLGVRPRHDVGVHYHLARAYRSRKEPDRAAQHLLQALRLRPGYHRARIDLADLLVSTGRAAEAVPQLRRAIDQRPDAPQALNDLAWLLATHHDPAVRRPAEAVDLAERANASTGHRIAAILDTLAAAYASDGKFSPAVTTAENALALAEVDKADELARQIRQRLSLYKQHKPFFAPPVQD